MYCEKCGTKIPDDAIFCSACGKQISNTKSLQENRDVKKKLSYTSDTLIQNTLSQNGQGVAEKGVRRIKSSINNKIIVVIGAIITVVVVLVAVLLLKNKVSHTTYEDGLFIAEYEGFIMSDGFYNDACSIYRIDMGSGKSKKISHFDALSNGYDCYYYALGSRDGHDPSYQKACVVLKDGGSEHVGWIDTKGNITDVSKIYLGENDDDFYGNITHGGPKFDREGYFYFVDTSNHVVVRVLANDKVKNNDFEVVATNVEASSFYFRCDGKIAENNCNSNSRGDRDINSSDIWLTDDEYISATDGFPVCFADKPGNYVAKNIQYSIIAPVKGRVNESPTISPDKKKIAFLSYLRGEDIVNLFTVAIAPDQKPTKIDVDMDMRMSDYEISRSYYAISEWRGLEGNNTNVQTFSNQKKENEESNEYKALGDSSVEKSIDYALSNEDTDDSDNNEHKEDDVFPSESNQTESLVIEDVWGLDGANEGPLPSYIFEKVKGTYYSEINGLWIYIDSPSQMILESGAYRSRNYIEGCDSAGTELLIYTYEDSTPIILSIFHTENGGICMNTLEGGEWDYDNAHVHASLERVSNNVASDYLIPDSSSRLLTEADLAGMSKKDLKKARNEIVARHGRRFKDIELQAYFDSQTWYFGAIDPDVFDRTVELSDIERKNMDFIKKHEK